MFDVKCNILPIFHQTGWMNKFGKQLDLPLDGQAETKYPYSGKKYILAGKELKITGSEQCN